MNKWDLDLVDRIIAQSRKVGSGKPPMIVTQAMLDYWKARHEALIDPPFVKAFTLYCKEISRAGKEYEKSCFPDYLQGVSQD